MATERQKFYRLHKKKILIQCLSKLHLYYATLCIVDIYKNNINLILTLCNAIVHVTCCIKLFPGISVF